MNSGMTSGGSRPKVKVCGVTRPEDAILAAELGADYLGLNFARSSPRYLTLERAREIAAAVRERVPTVRIAGVFVNHSPAEVAAIDRDVGLDLLQFSGDEGADEVNRYASRAIKVFRTGGDPGPEALAAYPDVWALLVDARHGVLYGGTGLAWPYAAVAALAARRRVFVAGGLRPGNVGPALAGSRPYGIDVCSGVESAPGIKDRALLERLFVEVRNGQGTPPS